MRHVCAIAETKSLTQYPHPYRPILPSSLSSNITLSLIVQYYILCTNNDVVYVRPCVVLSSLTQPSQTTRFTPVPSSRILLLYSLLCTLQRLSLWPLLMSSVYFMVLQRLSRGSLFSPSLQSLRRRPHPCDSPYHPTLTSYPLQSLPYRPPSLATGDMASVLTCPHHVYPPHSCDSPIAPQHHRDVPHLPCQSLCCF